MSDWAIRDNQVIVTVTLPNGTSLELTRDQALRLARDIEKTARSAPCR